MKSENTSIRLKKIMMETGLKQIDILKLAAPFCEKYGTSLQKNDLSQYVSGKVEPGNEKLTVLAKALNVNEVWLMGYDVPSNPEFGKNLEEQKIIENSLKTYTLQNGAELTINKKNGLTIEDALKMQTEINRILMEELNNNKK